MRTCTLQQELDLLPTRPAHVSTVRWVLQPLTAVPQGSALCRLLAAASPLGSSSALGSYIWEMASGTLFPSFLLKNITDSIERSILFLPAASWK